MLVNVTLLWLEVFNEILKMFSITVVNELLYLLKVEVRGRRTSEKEGNHFCGRKY